MYHTNSNCKCTNERTFRGKTDETPSATQKEVDARREFTYFITNGIGVSYSRYSRDAPGRRAPSAPSVSSSSSPSSSFARREEPLDIQDILDASHVDGHPLVDVLRDYV